MPGIPIVMTSSTSNSIAPPKRVHPTRHHEPECLVRPRTFARHLVPDFRGLPRPFWVLFAGTLVNRVGAGPCESDIDHDLGGGSHRPAFTKCIADQDVEELVEASQRSHQPYGDSHDLSWILKPGIHVVSLQVMESPLGKR